MDQISIVCGLLAALIGAAGAPLWFVGAAVLGQPALAVVLPSVGLGCLAVLGLILAQLARRGEP